MVLTDTWVWDCYTDMRDLILDTGVTGERWSMTGSQIFGY